VPQPSRLWPLRARPQPRPIADIHVAIEGEGGTGGNIFSLAQRKGFPPVQSSRAYTLRLPLLHRLVSTPCIYLSVSRSILADLHDLALFVVDFPLVDDAVGIIVFFYAR